MATVTRQSFDHSFGFGAGVLETGEHIIVKVTPGGVAEGHLGEGWIVLSILSPAGWIQCSDLSHDEFVDVCCDTENSLQMVVRIPAFASSTAEIASASSQHTSADVNENSQDLAISDQQEPTLLTNLLAEVDRVSPSRDGRSLDKKEDAQVDLQNLASHPDGGPTPRRLSLDSIGSDEDIQPDRSDPAVPAAVFLRRVQRANDVKHSEAAQEPRKAKWFDERISNRQLDEGKATGTKSRWKPSRRSKTYDVAKAEASFKTTQTDLDEEAPDIKDIVSPDSTTTHSEDIRTQTVSSRSPNANTNESDEIHGHDGHNPELTVRELSPASTSQLKTTNEKEEGVVPSSPRIQRSRSWRGGKRSTSDEPTILYEKPASARSHPMSDSEISPPLSPSSERKMGLFWRARKSKEGNAACSPQPERKSVAGLSANEISGTNGSESVDDVDVPPKAKKSADSAMSRSDETKPRTWRRSNSLPRSRPPPSPSPKPERRKKLGDTNEEGKKGFRRSKSLRGERRMNSGSSIDAIDNAQSGSDTHARITEDRATTPKKRSFLRGLSWSRRRKPSGQASSAEDGDHSASATEEFPHQPHGSPVRTHESAVLRPDIPNTNVGSDGVSSGSNLDDGAPDRQDTNLSGSGDSGAQTLMAGVSGSVLSNDELSARSSAGNWFEEAIGEIVPGHLTGPDDLSDFEDANGTATPTNVLRSVLDSGESNVSAALLRDALGETNNHHDSDGNEADASGWSGSEEDEFV